MAAIIGRRRLSWIRFADAALRDFGTRLADGVPTDAAVVEATSAADIELLADTSVLGGPRATFAIAGPHIALPHRATRFRPYSSGRRQFWSM